jgi:hypothetical protein
MVEPCHAANNVGVPAQAPELAVALLLHCLFSIHMEI